MGRREVDTLDGVFGTIKTIGNVCFRKSAATGTAAADCDSFAADEEICSDFASYGVRDET